MAMRNICAWVMRPASLDAPLAEDPGTPALADTLGEEDLGISQMHVSRLLAHALGYLRERIPGPHSHAPRAARFQ